MSGSIIKMAERMSVLAMLACLCGITTAGGTREKSLDNGLFLSGFLCLEASRN